MNSNNQENNNSRNQEWFRFSRPTGILSMVSAMGVGLSVLYDWSFLSALGISFSEAPTNLNDHIQSWLIWLPIVLLAILLLVAIRVVEESTKAIDSEGLDDQPPQSGRRIQINLYTCIGSVAFFISLFAILFGMQLLPRIWYYWAFVILWIAIAGWVIERLFSLFTKALVFFVPLMFLIIYFMGQYDANEGISAEDPNYKIYYYAGSDHSTADSEILLLRTFDDWLLIRDQKQNVHWIPSRDIKQIQLINESKPFIGIVCLFIDSSFGPFCPGPTD